MFELRVTSIGYSVPVFDVSGRLMSLPEYDEAGEPTDTYIRGGYYNMHIAEVPVEVARQSGHFQSSGTEELIVQMRFLNQFAVIAPHSCEEDDCKSEHSPWEFAPSDEKIVSWWERAGFPSEVKE